MKRWVTVDDFPIDQIMDWLFKVIVVSAMVQAEEVVVSRANRDDKWFAASDKGVAQGDIKEMV